MIFRRIIVCLMILAVIPAIAEALPSSLNIQGKLTNPSGTALQGNYNFSFTIYDDYTSGNELLRKNVTLTTDSNGVYNVLLTGINTTFEDEYYLGITVGTDNESTPRINMSSAPYSFRANISDSLREGNIYKIAGLTINTSLASGNFAVYNDTSSVFFVDGSSGKVGIGTESPISRLHVLGNIIVSAANNILSLGAGNITGSLVDSQIANDITIETLNDLTVGGGYGSTGVTLDSATGDVKGDGDFLIGGDVYLSGDQYLVQGKVINGSHIPFFDNMFDLGNASNRWQDLFAINGNMVNLNVTNNISLGDKITFAFGEFIDNVVDGWVKVTGNLNVSENIRAKNATFENLNVTGTSYLGNLEISTSQITVDTVNALTKYVNIPSPTNISGGLNVSNGLIVNSGNVGIGTASPDHPFSVAASPILIGQDETAGVSIYLGQEGAADKALVINYDVPTNKARLNIFGDSSPLGLNIIDGGNVGIGTTSPTTALDVVGTINATAVRTGMLNVTGTSYLGSVTLNADNITVNNVVSKDGNISFFNSSGSEKMRIVQNGNVGIGTTSPTDALLDVRGTVSTAGDARWLEILYDDTALAAGVGGGITFGGKYTDAGAITNFASVWSEKEDGTTGNFGSELHFGTRTHGAAIADRMIIDASGNVGIGTTSPTLGLLQLDKASGNDVDLALNQDGVSHWRLRNAATTGDFGIYNGQ
ncbi:MAG: hypothetical protein QF362_02865, partial [Candidatus Woesearchaeota archaeon]|nr:hypothetical protein [Candidatus Woesearchaeota archaeon]